ncbi:TPA: response regulator transcription factor [Pseudomonas putida]|nr:response regulator transcription factor [Pseudomonas putida]
MKLTRREKEVVILLLDGNSNKCIAKQLGISPYTVRDHVSKILAKYQLHSRVELALLALKLMDA